MNHPQAMRTVLATLCLYALALLVTLKGFVPFPLAMLVFVLVPDSAGASFRKCLSRRARRVLRRVHHSMWKGGWNCR